MPSPETSFSPELTRSQFVRIRRMVYEHCGLNLTDGKEGLVRSRLAKRLRKLAIPSFEQYVGLLQQKDARDEFLAMVDALTTNQTSFFREPSHFEFLRTQVLPSLASEHRPIRIWSAGCSSGEEPYSVAILLRESIADPARCDCRILATDISSRMLDFAREGVYDSGALEKVPALYRNKYFAADGRDRSPRFRVIDSLRHMIRFARLNLMAQWPMRGLFDLVLCRNVMIYFDKPTQAALVKRFWAILKEGGYLLVGHSENLTRFTQDFTYVQPATYVK